MSSWTLLSSSIGYWLWKKRVSMDCPDTGESIDVREVQRCVQRWRSGKKMPNWTGLYMKRMSRLLWKTVHQILIHFFKVCNAVVPKPSYFCADAWYQSDSCKKVIRKEKRRKPYIFLFVVRRRCSRGAGSRKNELVIHLNKYKVLRINLIRRLSLRQTFMNVVTVLRQPLEKTTSSLQKRKKLWHKIITEPITVVGTV